MLHAPRCSAPLAILALLATAVVAQTSPPPQTRAEASGYLETSRLADVQRFVDALVALPHGNRLAVEVAGKSHEGRPLLLVRARLPEGPPPRLRALVIADIHGGEVDGKEAVLELLREIALGEHTAVLQHCELWCVPIYNPDGNEQLGPKNRPGQNGPPQTGQRPNGQKLDLNRDFVKAEAPETRTLLALFARFDPHLFFDLHTTNGSYHGYHLTYAPSLSPNVDRDLQRLSRALLDATTAAMQQHDHLQTFDYGNFETRDWDGGGAPRSTDGVRGWYSYDHRPRYGVNYFGLRNRIGILSESYSYCDFATRIAASKALVRRALEAAVAQRDAIVATCQAADARLARGDAPTYFGFDTGFAPPEMLPVLVGEVETLEPTGEGTRNFARKGDGRPETMPVFRSFSARQQRALPAGWLVLAASPEVTELLRRHGIVHQAVPPGERVRASSFAVDKKRKPQRPFQGHQELFLTGSWSAPTDFEVPAGSLLVPGRQPLARLAAQLLEAESEDSLSVWNFFEAQTTNVYPVLRLADLPDRR